MHKGLRYLAVSVSILLWVAVTTVFAAPGKIAANIENTTSQTDNLAPPQSAIVRLFIR